jgi:hypothetical protein
MKNILFPILCLSILLTGCIGDDIIFDEVAETVRITNPLDSIAVGDTYQMEAMFTNNVGKEEMREITWSSSDTGILTVDENGLVTAVEKGTAEVKALVELDGKPSIEDTNTIVVDEETVVTDDTKSGTLVTTSSYKLEGSFTISETDNKLTITFNSDYEASTALPGLYVYLGNNPSSLSNALEIGAVNVFDGEHTYEIPNVNINTYQYLLYWCKPFNVKVGQGEIE